MNFKTDEERNNFVIDNMSLVPFLVNRYFMNYVGIDSAWGYEDILQLGYISLIKATNKFDEENINIKFSYWLRLFMKREFQNTFREVRCGIRYKRDIPKKRDMVIKLANNGLTDKEISKKIGMSLKDIDSMKQISYNGISLDALDDDGEETDFTSIDRLMYKSKNYSTLDIEEDILEGFSERDKDIFKLAKIGGFTHKEIAKKYNMSAKNVGRIICDIKKGMKEKINPDMKKVS